MLNAEKNYEFRKRLLNIHKKNIKDLSITAKDFEFEIRNGFTLILPEKYGDVTLTAAKDFVDYLFVSMEISAMISKNEPIDSNCLILALNPSLEKDYIINVNDKIYICAKNERMIAQALYCLEDKLTENRAPIIKKQEISHTYLFSPRMTHSGYGLDIYPDEQLSAIAHAGMDSILVFVKGVNETPMGFMDFNELIYRAGKYGLDVYAYSYLKSEKHPEDADAQEFYDKLYGEVFEKCPGFKGIILVGESVEFPSKDEKVSKVTEDEYSVGIPQGKPSPGWWPCYDYPLWLDCVKKAIYKHKKDADIIFWTYNWGYAPEEDRIKLIKSLPTDISLLVTYEMFEKYDIGDISEFCADYTLAFEGPGKYFISEAQEAKKRGIRLYTMSNTAGMTWDMGLIPYEPMPNQWIKRYVGLRKAQKDFGLCGLMESHHYGYWPSFIGNLAKKSFIKECDDYNENLKETIFTYFGKENYETTKKALELWSEAITYYIPSDANQWGSFRVGPSYPLCLIKEIKTPSFKFAHFGNVIFETTYPADYHPTGPLPTGRGMLPSLRVNEEIKSLEKMLSLMEKGVEILETVKNTNTELEYLLNLGKYICCYTKTGINAIKWYSVTSKMKAESDGKKIKELVVKAREIIHCERENAIKAMEFTDKDSRLGWEPSMDYLGDSAHIKWKLNHLDYVENTELAIFDRNADKSTAAFL